MNVISISAQIKRLASNCGYIIASCSFFIYSTTACSQTLELPMSKGPMSDYGASPWYVRNVGLGTSPMSLAFDTGSNFIWATSDQCNTTACNQHAKVNTTQSGFKWIDKTPQSRSFGLWGTMTTWTGEVAFNFPGISFSISEPFFASVDYTGNQFGFLDWDGGVGFPSESSHVEAGSGFFFRDLYYNGHVGKPEYSFYTDSSGVGNVALGGDVPNVFDPKSEVRLEPKKTNIDYYLWGTELHFVAVGSEILPQLIDQILFLDTGSSRFKGDGKYIYPILNILFALNDSSGNPIFEKYFEAGDWTGLSYIKGGPSDYPNLPSLTLSMGQSCNGNEKQAVQLALSPEQYSYVVEVGERQGKYIVAVHRLDDIGGLLVGSTLMELIYTRFTHGTPSENVLTQSNMYLYEKSNGRGPYQFMCVSN